MKLLSTLIATTLLLNAPEKKPIEANEAAAKKKTSAAKDPRYAKLPTPKATPAWAPPAASKKTLKNGLTVWQMGGSKTPLVSIYLMLPTGSSADPEGKEGLSLLTADMLDEGAGKYSALELSDKLGELATDYGAQAGVDYVLLSMDGLSENLEESLELLADIVLRSQLSEEEFDRRKKHHLATALTSRDDPKTARSKAASRVLFGQGYAGAPATGTVSSLERITWADVKEHASRMTVPEGAHLAIAGMADSEVIERAVNKAFGEWKGKLSLPEIKVEEPLKGKNAYVIDFADAAQSALLVATRAGSDDDPNYFAEEVMNEKLGASFTGRINMNLREDKGYTYGAFSLFRRYRRAGYFGVQTNVKSETTIDSVKEIYSELSALCADRPLTDQERNESVEGLLLGYPMRFDQVSSLGYRLVALPIHNRAENFWQTWPSEIKKITTTRANEAAKPYCDAERYSVVIAGDAASVSPELKKMGFSVTALDRDGNPTSAKDDVKKGQ